VSVRVGGSARGGWRHESEQRERQRQNEGERVWGREHGRERKIVNAHGREKVCVCALAHVDYIEEKKNLKKNTVFPQNSPASRMSFRKRE